MRRMLPPEALLVKMPVREKPEKWWRKEDTHLFVISFGAFFTAISTFIA
jgi:hypothetical protein